MALAATAAQADGLLIGVAAPITGPSARLGAQNRAGAEAGASATSPQATLDIVDDQCSADGGTAAANDFVAAKVNVVVGFLCTESIEAAMPILKGAGLPVITVGVRTNSLTDRKYKTGWPVFRLAPRSDAEGIAVSSMLIELWRNELFAIIDDGTIYGRELAESVRAGAEQEALKPVFVDTYRPELDNQVGLVGRLRRAGATHAFVGGDLDDVAIIGRDAAGIGMTLTLAGGEALRAAPGAVALLPGTLMVGLPDPAEIAKPEALAALKARGTVPDGYVLPAYAGVEVARQALAKAAAGGSVADALGKDPFETALGSIRFDAKGDLSDNPFRMFRYDGRKFEEVGEP
ncbi:MAG: branched-chain amino acid ABC transporter substrate-binding protein [Mesorhizobium sp.]